MSQTRAVTTSTAFFLGSTFMSLEKELLMRRHTRWRRIGLTTLLGILISVGPAMAQTPGSGSGRAASSSAQHVSFGVLGGVSAAHMTLPVDAWSASDLSAFGITVDNHVRTGSVGGVFVDMPAASLLSFETGALVSLKGTAVDVTTSGRFQPGAFKLLYLDLPFLACADLLRTTTGRISVLAGATVGINISAKAAGTAFGQSFTQITPFGQVQIGNGAGFPRMDYSITIAGRTEVRHVLFEVRYDHGLKNLVDSSRGSPLLRTLSFPVAKNRSLQFMTGYRF
jgi:hypothetical protein